MASSEKPIGTEYLDQVQALLDSTMPWIGMYIAAASAVCTLAMAADAFIGFRSKKYWLPCKYFSLNAFSLTLLAVAMKLPVDLTNLEKTINDNLARISSLVLMSTAMSNFMTSLGGMENNEILLNMAALGILVITIAGNVCIHLVQMRSFPYVLYVLLPQQATYVAFMLFLLVMLCCMSLMVDGAEIDIGLKYDEIHKSFLVRQVEYWGRISGDEVENMVKGYWVMAQTNSSQLVLETSAISPISGLLCLFVALFLLIARIRNSPVISVPSWKTHNYFWSGTSNYGWSVRWIMNIQCVGVAIGTIAPLMRWFAALRFKISQTERKSFRDEVMVGKYWTLILVKWRDGLLPFQVQNRACKKLLRGALRIILNFFIGVQILFVAAAKLVSAKFGCAVFLCFCKNKRPVLEAREGAQVEFRQYVLLLEGEPQLPSKILKNICNEADELIKVGQEKQPKEHLMLLLKKSSNDLATNAR